MAPFCHQCRWNGPRHGNDQRRQWIHDMTGGFNPSSHWIQMPSIIIYAWVGIVHVILSFVCWHQSKLWKKHGNSTFYAGEVDGAMMWCQVKIKHWSNEVKASSTPLALPVGFSVFFPQFRRMSPCKCWYKTDNSYSCITDDWRWRNHRDRRLILAEAMIMTHVVHHTCIILSPLSEPTALSLVTICHASRSYDKQIYHIHMGWRFPWYF